MWIVKLGGSLWDSPVLGDWLAFLAQQNIRSVVIVPGGGPFANQVRVAQHIWRFSDEHAHHMALLAMQQMAIMLQSIENRLPIVAEEQEIHDRAINSSQSMIWSPNIEKLAQASIPKSWDVTSDSLAAWMAAELNAKKLVMIKSIKVSPDASISKFVLENVVDKAFNLYFQKAEFSIKFMHREDLQKFTSMFVDEL